MTIITPLTGICQNAPCGIFWGAASRRAVNWVRLTYVSGDESWKEAPLSSEDVRRGKILDLGLEWTNTDRDRIAKEYFDWLQRVRTVFGSGDTVDIASHQELTNAILAIHAFHDQDRFTKGGVANLPIVSWEENDNDTETGRAVSRRLPAWSQSQFRPQVVPLPR